MHQLKLSFAVVTSFLLLFACSSDGGGGTDPGGPPQGIVNINYQAIPTTQTNPGSMVMMQAFYWDVTDGGVWWNTIDGKLADWRQLGIDAIWLPPVQKSQSGPFSMGYDPFDYFDFGEFNQHGTVETRFGSRTELETLISTAHANGINVIADIVLNHNSGGNSETNGHTGGSSFTSFAPASGKFPRTYDDFHPNDIHASDIGFFGGFPDLCHDKQNVKDWFYLNSDSVAKYYKDVMGFDGWRFDYVKGFDASWVNEWMTEVGGFGIGEYWDGSSSTVETWANAANVSAFDFPTFYQMERAFDKNDFNELSSANMLHKRNPFKAVTFVANHDTEKDSNQDNRINNNNKDLAYAYILTHEGYPCIFYSDYEGSSNQDMLKRLIWVHNNLAGGSTEILHVDTDEYIAKRNGFNNSGLVVYLNGSSGKKTMTIQTNWNNTVIGDYGGNTAFRTTTSATGMATIEAPAGSFTVWAPLN